MCRPASEGVCVPRCWPALVLLRLYADTATWVSQCTLCVGRVWGVCRELGVFLTALIPGHAMSVAPAPGSTASVVLQDGTPVLTTLFYNSRTSLPAVTRVRAAVRGGLGT